ncbi:DNA translocase FtsK [Bacillus sp. z60-18]|uniref:DNA translocase FtsK n=1 Tax=Bacillus TaxID=1386 RepID=UPI00098B119A|nr:MULTISPECIES: DNA translocase FtsK [Bacillus]WFA04159.1 DNA translocase FtsK [Bacillus sp. HSf4]
MSWFNKMFSLFLGDDENSEKQTNQTEQTMSDSSFEENEEMPQIADAKVVYEYPKGKFRFPVIPDQKSPQREQNEGRHTRNRRTGSRPSAYQPKTNHSAKGAEQTAKKPFRPSVIPSPVYGFNEQKRARPNDLAKNNTYGGRRQEGVTLFSEEIKNQQNFAESKPPMPEQPAGTDPTPFANDPQLRPKAAEKSRNFFDKESTMEQVSMQEPHAPMEKRAEKGGPGPERTKEKPEPEPPISVQEPPAGMEQPAESGEPEGTEEQSVPQISVQENPDGMGREPHSEGNEEKSVPHDIDEPVGAEEEAEDIALPLTEEAEKNRSFYEDAQSPAEDEWREASAESAGPAETGETAIYAGEAVFFEDEVQTGGLEESAAPEQGVEPYADEQNEQTAAQDQARDVDHADSEAQDEQPIAEKAEHSPTVPHKPEVKHTSKPSQGTVPFNVMMLPTDKQKEKTPSGYQFPNLSLLDVPPAQKQDDHVWINEQRELLDVTLENFNVKANVVHVTQGPSVTRFEVHPEPGVKVNKITNLSDDIKLSLSAKDIRIEAPIPGKNTIGIEVPNLHSKMVYLREMVRSSEFRTNPSPLTAALGLDISGKPVVADLKKMPHGLIAGATGSGKSVCINTILVSLLFKAAPTDVKLLLIDPKMVELAPYNEIPHLVSPVITDAKAATAALKWVVEEMERRYELFAHSGVREIERFNEKVRDTKMGEKLPYLVVVIDELADLMMVAPNEVEESICRIAQKARACGIHLLIATQRPSVDVITGLIKANIPTRIAFSVSSGVDSRTIIDMAGAEKLLGKGDMLFLENGSGKPVRLQGNFVSDHEIDRVVSHVRKQQKPSYLFEQEELIRQNPAGFDQDELFLEACEFAVEQNSASTSSLQRRFRIGYNRAARLIDMMESEGMISEAKGSKPREVLITKADLEQLIESSSLFS